MIRSHFAARLATTLIIGFMISLMSSSCKTNYISTLPPVATQPSAPRGTGGLVPEHHVPRVAVGSITIDGRADEPAWNLAPPIPLSNYWPDRPTTQRTLVRLLHTGTHLLVSFVCEDDNIVATHTARDDHTFRDDCAEILFAAPVDGPPNEGLNIEINPAGYWNDVLFRVPNWLNHDWSPSDIEVATNITPSGWSVECSIPFSALADVVNTRGYDAIFDPAKRDFARAEAALRQTPPVRLRANFARWHRPENAMTIWSDPQRPRPHPLELDRYGWLLFQPEKVIRQESPSKIF
ncbi:carbohydrate-binding family 9-like protein [Geminisphaera colitermitum]|uniref:carbohydrate-binding family 9-like protein n=1 Tax=Geminisphaera colitermitum TaxID=1148786 RepID=UPI000158C77E|nr:carbohydrate-binding family 9-like protein [Geminisphaera colitermitum]